MEEIQLRFCTRYAICTEVQPKTLRTKDHRDRNSELAQAVELRNDCANKEHQFLTKGFKLTSGAMYTGLPTNDFVKSPGPIPSLQSPKSANLI